MQLIEWQIIRVQTLIIGLLSTLLKTFLLTASRLGYFKHALQFYVQSDWVVPRSRSVVKQAGQFLRWAIKNSRSITMISTTLFTVLLCLHMCTSKGKPLSGSSRALWSERKNGDTFFIVLAVTNESAHFKAVVMCFHMKNTVGISYNFIQSPPIIGGRKWIGQVNITWEKPYTLATLNILFNQWLTAPTDLRRHLVPFLLMLCQASTGVIFS